MKVLWLADMISGSSTTRTSQAERRPLTTSHGSEASNSVPPSVISSVPGSAFAAPTAFAPNNATIGRVVGGEPMSARSSDAGQSDITNSVQSVHYVAQSSSIQRLWRAYSISTNKTPYSERLGEVQEDRVLNRANTAAVNHASETDVIHVGMLNDTPENKLFTPIVDDNADEDSPVQRSGMRQRRRSNSMLELK